MRHWDSEVLVLAGESRASLIEQGQRLSRFLESAPQIALRDLGYTLNTGLGGQPYRVALVGSSVDDLETKLERALEALADGRRARIKMRSGIYFFQEPLSRTGKLAFLFPGEGSQYVNMLRDLCLAFPEVRAWFDRIDQAFLQIGSKDYRPSALVFPPPASEAHSERNEQRIWDMDAAVAVVTTANLALLTLSRRLGIRPDALVGHSTGEYTALQAAGIMDVNGDEAFVQLAADMDGVYRQVAERDGIPRASLVAAGADAGTVSAILDRIHGGAFVAMDNCLHQTVVVGQQDAVRRFTEEAQQQGIICEALPFDRPYHTPLFEPYVDSMEPFFDRWITSLPQTQIYSCTTTAPFAADLTEIQELALQHWTRPVRFRQTIETMYADGVRVFVEVGPRGNLSAFVNDILRGQPHAAVPLNVQSRSGIAQLNHAVALLAAHAVPMELGHLYEDRRASALALEPGLGSQPRVEPMSTMTLALELPYLQLNQGGEERTGGQPSAPCEASWQADSAARDPESSSQASTDIQEAPSASATRRDPDLARERVEEASKAGSARDERPERGLQRSPSTGSRVEVQGDAPSVDTTGSTRSRVVHSYLWTMERFLEMQQEMMQRYLAHAGHGPSSDWSGEWSEGITGGISPVPFPHRAHDGPGDEWADTEDEHRQPGLATSAEREASGTGLRSMALAPEAQTPRTSESESRISEPGSPLDAETVEQILLRLVSERTGYPTEMLDLNLDLEADLGIDSIKRVEILGSFQQELGLNLSGELEELAARRTLQGMIDYLADGRGKSNSQPAAATSAQQGSSPAGEGSLQVSPSDPGDLTGDRGGGAASYPLAGEIVALTAGESAVTKVEISLDAYPFLRDHTLGRRISVTDPQLTGLPIVPLTMSMEMMAEAAAILMPRMRLVAMRDVRAYRWIALDEESVTLELSARRLPAQQAVHVQLREGSTGDQRSMASTAPIVEGVMAFAEEYPVPPTARELALADECPSKWSANRLYPDAMFHGPAFQGVQSLDRVGQDGAEATLEALPLKDLFASGDPDLLQTDLVLLDQPGQVVGFWAMQQLEESRLVFPFHLEALHLYGPPLPPRERLRCLARIELIGSEQTRSDLDIVGPDGSMWATLAGWQDRRFDVPWSFFEFQLKPRDVMLGRPWPTPVVRSIGLDAYLLSADDFPDGFFNAYGGIWRRVLAHLVLSRRERELWRRLRTPPPRQLEWLLGRVVAKDAVRQLLKQRYDLNLCPADVEILPDEEGRPVVRGAWAAQVPHVPLLSIAHSAGVAVAVVGDGEAGAGVGVDIEALGRMNADIEELAFAAEERELLSAVQGVEEDEWPLRFWCAKEAVAKALGHGMVGGPRSLVVQALDAASGVLQLGLTGEMARRAGHADGGNGHPDDLVMTAPTAREGHLIVAVCLDRAGVTE